MKRRTFTAGALAAGALAACSSESGPIGDPDQPVTLTYSLWDDTFRPGYEKALEHYRKTNPNINVEFVVTPFDDYDTKLQAGMQSKTAPDVFWLQDSFRLYATNDGLLDVTDRIVEDEVDLADFSDASIDSFKVEGRNFGLPWTTISAGLFYNKKLFDAAGLDHPTEDWTWEDAHAAAERLTDAEAGVYGLASPVTGQLGYYNTIYQAGGQVISDDGQTSGFDTPEAIAGLEFWVEIARQGWSPTPAQLTDTSADQLFASGKLAMFYGGSWATGSLAESEVGPDMDIAPLPAGKTRTVDATSACNAISASTKYPDAAWKWVAFLATKEAQDIQASGGIVCPANAKSKDAWVNSLPDYNMGVFVDQASDAKPQPASINTFAWRNQEPTILTPAWEGKAEVSDVARQMAEAMNTALAAERK